jgi:UDP-N-acetylmuramyl pentapeptide phosphotransferase/UDP-N-acetylglucosamine-1-phosphate transferase
MLGSGAVIAVGAASGELQLPLWLLPVAAAVIVAYVNAFNFMDGVNGISGLQAVVVGLLLAVSGGQVGASHVQLGGVAIAGAAIGFLPFNAPRARCFLGDIGSYFIGSWIAIVCIVAFDQGVDAVAIGCMMAIYASDTAWTLVRRVRRGERWWTSHREHVYQRLTDCGWSHTTCAMVVAAFAAVAGACGLLASGHDPAYQVIAALAAGTVCAVYLGLPRLASRGGRLAPAGGEPTPTPW